MKSITLTAAESRQFEEAVSNAARIYHERSQQATRALVPAFGVDDQPASGAPPVDPVASCALMVTMAALEEVRDDLFRTRNGIEQRGPLALICRWAREEDETDIETVTTIRLDDPATTGAMLLQAIFNANVAAWKAGGERRPGKATMALLERLTRP